LMSKSFFENIFSVLGIILVKYSKG